jgi:hypothetical protein
MSAKRKDHPSSYNGIDDGTPCEPMTPSSLAAMPGSARPGVNRISKYLRVVTEASLPGERGVISNDGKLIAILGYYKAWRQWVMYPQPNTVWSEDCLQAIREHLKQLVQVPNATS